eukprot:597215-Pelagomonas_calceolata.AAC.1
MKPQRAESQTDQHLPAGGEDTTPDELSAIRPGTDSWRIQTKFSLTCTMSGIAFTIHTAQMWVDYT